MIYNSIFTNDNYTKWEREIQKLEGNQMRLRAHKEKKNGKTVKAEYAQKTTEE